MFYQSLVLVLLLATTSQSPVARQFGNGSKTAFYRWAFLWGGVVLFWYWVISEPPAVFWTYVLLVIAISIARTRQLRLSWFRLWTAGCVVLAYTISILFFIPTYYAHQRALARNQPIDLKLRLAYERPVPKDDNHEHRLMPAMEAKPATHVQSPRFDPQLLEHQSRRFKSFYDTSMMANVRAETFRSLSTVHEGFVADFIAQPAFGVGRLPAMHLLTEDDLKWDDWKDRDFPEEPILQPAVPTTAAEEASSKAQQQTLDIAHALAGEKPEQAAPKVIPSQESLQQLHLESVVLFAPKTSFGGVNAQFEVRGFQPHTFRRLPDTIHGRPILEEWKMARLDLISLLKHQPPAVYLSAHLPSMDELRDAPTRPTTKFEEVAISKLYAGEELVIETNDQTARMVGSIRAIVECRKCHQVPLGGLLGAFSYRLTRVPIQKR